MRGRASPVAAPVAALLFLLPAAGRAADPFSWASPAADEVRTGRDAVARFGLADLAEVSVEVTDAWSPAGRKAVMAAEDALGKVAGVKRVIGPSGLLDRRVDKDGKADVVPALADPAGDPTGLVVPARLKRRFDALGMFLSVDGKTVRFLVEAPDLAAVRAPVTAALKASGLALAHADAVRSAGAAWLPSPDAGPLGPLRFLLIGVWACAGVVLSARMGRLSWRGLAVAALAAGAGPFLLLWSIDAPPLHAAALPAGLACSAMAGLGGLLARGAGRAPGTRGLAVAAVLAALVVGQAYRRLPDLKSQSSRWGRAAMLFAVVKGDMDDPLVLREIRRLCDWLRTLPGVAAAWAPTDVFLNFTGSEGEPARIPDDARAVRAVWALAAADTSVKLMLPPDHRSMLVALHLRDDTAEYGREVLAKLSVYLKAEFRTAMLPLAVGDKSLPAQARTVARGMGAADAKEHIARICARYGKILSEDDLLGIDRVAKQAAFVQTHEPARWKPELDAAVRSFMAGAGRPVPAVGNGAPAGQGDLGTLVAALQEQQGDHTVDDVKAVLALYSPSLPEADLLSTARDLHAAIADLRRRHAARINAKEMLFAADLPTTGGLAEEVRAATLDGMAPTFGVAVDPSSPGAILSEAAPFGGAANDRALAAAMRDGVRTSVLPLAIALAVLLLLGGGPRGLLGVPIALAPLGLGFLALVGRGRPLAMGEFLAAASLAALGGALAAAALFRRSDGAAPAGAPKAPPAVAAPSTAGRAPGGGVPASSDAP